MSWDFKKVSDAASLVTDYVANGSFADLAKNVVYKEDEDYAVLIRLVDYNNNFKGPFVFIDQSAYEFLAKSKLYGDEIIIANVGAVGTVFKCPHLKYKMSLAPNSIMVKFKGDNDFYYYWLSSPIGQFSIKTIVAGSAQPKFNKTNFREMLVPVPDLPTQHKIAAVLSSIDKKIALNRAINRNLEAMAKKLYDYWFVQFDFPDENGNPYKSSGGKMVYNEVLKRDIPEGWKVKKLVDLGSFKNGVNYDKAENGNKDYLIVNIRNITSTTLLLNESELDNINLISDKTDSYLVKGNDILIARSASPGATRIYEGEKENVIFCGFIICFSVKDISKRLFLFYFLKGLEERNKNIGNGSILKNISQDVLKEISVVTPNDIIIKDFNKRIGKLIKSIQLNQQQIQQLTNLRNRLLPLLMNGQVKVKNM